MRLSRVRLIVSPGLPSERAVPTGRVIELFKIWLSGTQPLALVADPYHEPLPLPRFLLGLQRTGRAWAPAPDPATTSVTARVPAEVAMQPLARAEVTEPPAPEAVGQTPRVQPLQEKDYVWAPASGPATTPVTACAPEFEVAMQPSECPGGDRAASPRG
ncbi:hypothetical protein ACSSS7_007391 [Eimeria intestinalis]